MLRKTAGGRDGNGSPYPVPSQIYDEIRAEKIRPLLALVLWDDATANEPLLLAIARAIATALLER